MTRREQRAGSPCSAAAPGAPRWPSPCGGPAMTSGLWARDAATIRCDPRRSARIPAICRAFRSIRRSSRPATQPRRSTGGDYVLAAVPAQQLREALAAVAAFGSGRRNDHPVRQGHRAVDRQAAFVDRRGIAAEPSDRRAFGSELRDRCRQGLADCRRHRGVGQDARSRARAAAFDRAFSLLLDRRSDRRRGRRRAEERAGDRGRHGHRRRGSAPALRLRW